jgi:hypothetical protein
MNKVEYGVRLNIFQILGSGSFCGIEAEIEDREK